MAERDITHRLRRAVKENNLALVKRLAQRTEIQNPDPAPCRYTSLAWAAVCGCEEVFEYLLLIGHDDDELSKDSEKNTILCLLAAVKANPLAPPNHLASDDAELQRSAIRMARLYWHRFPFMTDWSNQQGRTALHIAALHGRDEFVQMLCDIGADVDLEDSVGNAPLHYASAYGHIPVIQTLIERGCNFNAKNNDKFNPSDYAYSNNTYDALQETARTRFEVNKKSRVVQQQARRAAYGQIDNEEHQRRGLGVTGTRRWRSGSATTSASDSTDYEGGPSTSAPGSSQFSGHSSSGSLPRAPPSNGTVLTPIPSSTANRARNTSTSSSQAPTHTSRPSYSSSTTNGRSGSRPGSSMGTKSSSSAKTALSPIASRMLERDAGAMAEYRVRSESHSSTNTLETNVSNIPAVGGQIGTYTPATESSLSDVQVSDLRARTIPRSLRPSLSAASLRPHHLPSITSVASDSIPRIRAGTLNNVLGSSGAGTPKTPPTASTLLQTLKRPVLAVLPGGRSSDPTLIPNGHTRRPSGSLLRDIAAIRTDSM